MANLKGRLEARVKQDYDLGFVRAFSGHDYNQKQWIAVPAGAEAEAKNHPFLDTRPMQAEPKEEENLNAAPKMHPIGGAAHAQAESPQLVNARADQGQTSEAASADGPAVSVPGIEGTADAEAKAAKKSTTTTNKNTSKDKDK